MRLISLLVENFRGIRKAKLEFGAGLNVLHGPNDLGKSSLAMAVRAALLLQTTSKEYEEFVSWHGTGDPFVELVFESEPQRIWRVRKTFGGNAFLDESRNGIDFQNVKRGRDVDGQLSEILQWGLAPPGLKGRPKGMPMTFLSTALLAEQHRVDAIFERALSEDSDESGKKRMIEALQAVAEDPLYKKVLDRVQARVDRAYTATGRRKGDKDSPWVKVREKIKLKEQEWRDREADVQKTEAIEAEMRVLFTRQVEARDRVATAEEAHRLAEKRTEILGRLQLRKDALADVTGVIQRLNEAERQFEQSRKDVEAFAERELSARKDLDEAARQAQLAKDEVTRLQSEDLVRERRLQRETAERRCAELRTRQVEIEASLTRIERLRRAALRVSELEAESAKLEAGSSASKFQHERALKALEDSTREERDIRSIAQWMRAVQAKERRDFAASLEASEAALNLTPAQLQGLQKIDHELQVARARLEGSLEVSIQPTGKLRASVSADDNPLVTHDLDGALLEITARREIAIDIAGVAQIMVTGGSAEARRTAVGLQARWAAEVEPILKQTGSVNIAALAKKVEEGAVRAREIKEALDEAARLEERLADGPELVGAPETELEISSIAEADKKAAAVAVEVTKRTAEERRFSEEFARAAAAREANLAMLVPARAELAEAKAGGEGDWDAVRSEKDAINTELRTAQGQLTQLSSGDDEAVKKAIKVLERAEALRVAAEAAYEKATQDLRKTENLRAGIEGQLTLRREAAAQCDEAGTRAAVAQVEAELALVPRPAVVVSAEDLAAARLALERIEDDIQSKRGALQHVGGDVAKQHAADARAALQAEQQNEQDVQNEYAAWDLLRNTLIEAEREEGVHLGRALGGPIAERFGALTLGKYGAMNLGPDLDTPSITAAGGARDLRLLSVGTRDQLSTIFRLTLAEQLKSAVMLDDQLTQTDTLRMTWLRELIREVTGGIQVIVFTCRPSDYLLPEEMGGAIDLLKIIERSGALGASAAG